MRSFNSCWLNPFVSEVLFSATYWSCEECRMASGEEPSSHYICSKNASPFCGGSGTGKLSSWVIYTSPFCGGFGTGKLSSWVIYASPFSGGSGTGKLSSWGFSFVYTILCLFLAENPMTMTQQNWQSSARFFGSRHNTGIAKGIASRFPIVRSVTQSIWTGAAQCCLDLTERPQPILFLKIWYNCTLLSSVVNEPLVQRNVAHCPGLMGFRY